MRRLLFPLLFLAGAAQAGATGLAGDYQASIGQAGNSLQLRLSCRDDAHCALITTFDAPGAPSQPQRQPLDQVRPLADVGEAAAALRYAREHRAERPAAPDLAEAQDKLGTVLAAQPAIARCWDLNSPQAGYMLACALSGLPAGTAPLYLFSTLQTDGEAGFQRYAIYPLTRR
ncbi:hypothetical protein [Chromobacterium sp. CV08]|uniref:hypothetical protein n=1 Tax=Chromobacterium sp. CV08 TaxID=3133274 RepID=UPI003DA9BCFE